MTGPAIAAAISGQAITALSVTSLTVSAGGTLLLPDGTAAAPSLAFTSTPTTGLSNAGGLSLISLGVARLRTNATLEVTGVLRFNVGSFAEFFNVAADPGAPSQGTRLYSILDTGKSELRTRFPTGLTPFTQVVQEL